jgi:gliding motility-associated-like protein
MRKFDAKYIRMKFRLLITLFCFFIGFKSEAQTLVFAQLTGTPNMNTTGWNLTGAAATGDTGGDVNFDPDELILTNNIGNSSGAIFYNQAIDLGTCYQWNVQFDFRMFDGTSADGIAFCFLDVPPTGFVSGGGVGIPSTANGIKVVFDTYNNCGGANPEIQIYSGPGYNECIAGITTLNNVGGNLNFLRSSTYNTAVISYNYGVVTVSVNGTQYLTGTYNLNFAGYMGWTASTGGSNDRHSIRNATIYADIATSNAGPDVSVCSGQTAQIGSVNNPSYIYAWTTAPGLTQTVVSNPTVNLVNTGNSPLSQSYTVMTNLVSNPNSCPSFDSVIVTVNPLFNDTLPVSICQGSSYTLGTQTFSTVGYHPVVFPSILGCDSTVVLNLTLLPNLTNNQTVHICQGATYTFAGNILSTSGTYTQLLQTASGCDSTINLSLIVDPILTANIQAAICQGGSYPFGTQTLTTAGNYSRTIQTQAGCDSIINLTLAVNPVLSSSSSMTFCQGESTLFYGQTLTNTGVYSHTLQTVAGCDSVVTLNLTVYPIPSAPILTGNSPVECPGDLVTLTIDPISNAQYQWSGPLNFTSVNSTVFFPVQIQQMGNYSATISINGCVSSPSVIPVSITNIYEYEDFDFPNVITPNGDGNNDELDIEAMFKSCQEYQLKVINRWGNIIYSGKRFDAPFDGKDMNGVVLQDGVYFYLLEFDEKKKSGFIHLIR